MNQKELELKTIILNRIKTPDGTILTSYHRHDFQQYTDANGQVYMVDGGNDYLRRNVNQTQLKGVLKIWVQLLKLVGLKWNDPAQYQELSVYSDSPYEVIRENFHRGGRGKDGKQTLTWVPMSQMSNDWLKSCIVYNKSHGLKESYASKLYGQELNYRKEKNIFIAD